MPGFPVNVTFAVKEPIRHLFVVGGAVIGGGLGAAFRGAIGWGPAIAIACVGLLTGFALAVVLRQERCVERGCGAVIRNRSGVCPGCGGTIIGRLETGGSPGDA